MDQLFHSTIHTFHYSRWDNSAVASMLFFFPIGGVQEGLIESLTLLIPIWCVVSSVTSWDELFGCLSNGTAEVLMSFLNICSA